MKKSLLLVAFALSISFPSQLFGSINTTQSPVLPNDRKVKAKNGRTIVRDKSKPVRKDLEDWYARNIDAFRAKDVAAIMALRTNDFHTITPDGRVNTRADMEAYSQRFLARIDHFISLDFQIGTIEVHDGVATAEVTQKTIRMQRFPDGTLHKVEAGVVQRESWKKTLEGWKLFRVDNIQEGYILVDDKPFSTPSN